MVSAFTWSWAGSHLNSDWLWQRKAATHTTLAKGTRTLERVIFLPVATQSRAGQRQDLVFCKTCGHWGHEMG